MERNKIIAVLIKESYPEFMIEQTASKIENFDAEIKEAFELWLSDGTVPKITLEGYTFKDLVHQYGMKPIGAFITMDWLKKEPEKATKALERGIK